MSQPNLASAHTNAPVSLGTAVRFWLKLGCISFGGPAGQIALMQHELVEQKRWISSDRFNHALSFCMLLPGPEAQQLATYLGWIMHRGLGGVIAGALFVLPSLLLMIVLAVLYVRFGETTILQSVLYSCQCAVIALVLHAIIRLAKKTLLAWYAYLIAAAAFVAIYFLHTPFPWVVFCALALGFVFQRYWVSSDHHAESSDHAQRALDRDASSDPQFSPEAFSMLKMFKALIIALLLWALPFVLLLHFFGAEHRLSQMAWFFTKAALLTFGGAYAVLPYVHQGVVQQMGWVSEKDMMAGLALGESTPGPLVMVLVFIAYIAGFQLQGSWQIGVLAACLTCWFTFLPSFVFVLAGAPLVERTRKLPALSAPLSCLSAAMVGVMLSLALVFMHHVLWRKAQASPDWLAAAISAFAVVALVRWQLAIPKLLLVCAGLGMCVSLVSSL